MKIKKINDLVPIQNGMVFQYMMSNDKTLYMGTEEFELDDKLDVEVLRKVLSIICDQYDLFRTNIIYDNLDSPKSIVIDKRNIPFNIHDVEKDEDRKNKINKIKRQQFNKGFDIQRDSLLRIDLVNSMNKSSLLFTFHHIIMDGYSAAMFADILMSHYGAITGKVEEKELSYKDFYLYQDWVSKQDIFDGCKYWKKYLKDINNEYPLNITQFNTDIEKSKGKRNLTIIFTAEETESLLKVSSKNNCTLNIYLQWLWGLTLCRYFSYEEVTFGTVVSCRPRNLKDSDKILGPLINTVPVVFRPENDKNISEQLSRFRSNFIESMSYAWIGLGEITKQAGKDVNLINHLFVYDNFPEINFSNIEKNIGIKVTSFNLEETTEYPLTIEVSKGENIKLRFNYDNNIYSKESISRLAKLYRNICMNSISADYLKDILNISDEENKVEFEKISSIKDSFEHGNIISFFKKVVEEKKEQVAIDFNGNYLTYEALDLLSDKLAYKLYKQGMGINSRVAIDIKPSFEAIISMISILKLGGCYIPLDINLPLSRLESIVKETQVEALISSYKWKDVDLRVNQIIIDLDNLSGLSDPIDKEFLADRNENFISNIMFTSGTTSKPKGVVLNDGGILSLALDNSYIDYNNISCLFQSSTLAFDAATFEIWGSLLNGKKMVIVDKETFLSTEKFAEIIKQNKGCAMFITTSLFNNLVQRNPNIFKFASNVLVGGEKFSEYHGKLFLNSCEDTNLIHLYGPTESTAFTTAIKLTYSMLDKTVPIGITTRGRGVCIVDKNQNILPRGGVGEIYIYGQGLAKEYLGDANITKEKFIRFKNDTIAYKSGDYGYLDNNNILYFSNRKDEQIKYHGFRISLEEIEESLHEISEIQNAAVVLKENGKDDKRLVAYIVLTPNISFDSIETKITGELGEKLPYYMIPSDFVVIPKLPTKSNGKLDKSKLSEFKILNKSISKPKNKLEEIVCNLFKEVFDEKEINIDDSFTGMGGDSIKAMKLTSIAKKKGIDLSIGELYREQTPARISKVLEKKEFTFNNNHEIVPDTENRYNKFKLNNVQVAYLSGRSKDLVLGGYGTVFFTEIEGDYEKPKLQKALDFLIKKHDMLRAVIYEDGYQQILKPDEVSYEICEFDITDNKINQDEILKEHADKLRNKVFEIGEWPMFQVEIIRTGADKTHVLYAFDALIMDAYSVIMLAGELNEAYKGHFDNEVLDLSFRDYIIETSKESQKFVEDKKFWESKLLEFPKAPQLAFKNLPENIKSKKFNRKHKSFSKKTWENVQYVSKKLEVTPAIILCSMYAYVLSLFSGQSSLAINLTVFNREPIHPQIDKILGDFTKILLLDYDFQSKDSFVDSIQDTHKKLNQYIEHLNYDGIDFMRELVKIQDKKPINGRPMMPFVFTSALFDNDVDYDMKKASSKTPQVYLDCQAMVQNGNLNIVWDYPEELYSESLIDKMFHCFGDFIMNVGEISNRKFPIYEEAYTFYEKFNETTWEYNKKTLQQLVYDSLNNEENKSRVYIYDGDQSYTYEETGKYVYEFASFLQSKGIKCGDFVAIECDRSPITIFKILSIIICGAAYIPLQDSWPKERKEEIISQSGCKLYLKKEEKNKGDGNFKYSKTKLNDPAYIIYTSGSTGKPKGVLINQEAVVNTILDINDRFRVNHDDVLAAVSSFTFDLSVYDIFGSIEAGASISLVQDIRDVNEMINRVVKNRATIWNTVPAIMGILVEQINKSDNKINNIEFRLILLSGDWIPVDLPNRIVNLWNQAQIISLGGATEASIWSIAYKIDPFKKYKVHIPYGYPLRNQKMYVLNSLRELLPANTVGEIFIGGVGVADGYHNDIELTDNSFIQDDKLGRLYKTGDYGYISDEGCIEFCGRRDEQAKVNGLRIELGEIDSQIKEIDGIKESISRVFTNSSGGDYISTYIEKDFKIAEETSNNLLSKLDITEYQDNLISEYDIYEYTNIIQLLERYSLNAMMETLTTLGISRFNKKKITKEELINRLNIGENRKINFRQWFNILIENQFISYNNNFLEIDYKKLEKTDGIAELLKKIKMPEAINPIVDLAMESRSNLAEIMMGNFDPMSQMFFKNTDLQLGINVYRNSMTGQIFGKIAAKLVYSLIKEKQGEFKILEVGAGVGGTSDYIIDKIKICDNVRYTFTDLSDVFLDNAKERYKGYDFVDYKKYDINEHPSNQDMQLHSYDLIIGANVFHDAYNINQTVGDMQLLLKDYGKLMIIEVTVNTAIQMITAGFAEGLTTYKDNRVETDLPAYSEPMWIKTLEENNYTKPILYPFDMEARANLQTTLFLTRSKQLKAYVSEVDIIDKLKLRLPDYMIPKFIMEIQTFPLSDNGKVDLKRLAQPKVINDVKKELVKPKNQLEKEILELWKENLKINEIGVTENYFALGGDSLKAISLIGNLGEMGYHIDIKSVFRCTTIRDMAKEIELNEERGKNGR